MRGTSVGLVASMMLVLVTLPVGTAFHEELPDYPNKFSWAAPADYSGDLLIEIGLDYGTDNACVVFSGAAGRSDGSGLYHISMSDRSGWAASSRGSLAHAHAGPLDTRDVTDSSSGLWASQGWRWGEHFNGHETWTFAAFDLTTVTFGNETFEPFELEISCRDPFNVTSLAGGTTVIGFTQESLTGGVGASASTLVGPEASFNLHDGEAVALDTAEAVFAVRGFQIVGASAAEITLRSPSGGTGTYLVTTADPDIDHRGTGGAYDLRINRAGAALADSFWGILGGLDRVDDLDEITS